MSEALGWDVVPPTVLRDGPAGPGMVQLWREPDAGVRTRSTSCPSGRRRDGYLHVLDAVRRRRPAGLAGARGQRAAAPDGGLRRGGQQRRPQGRPRAGDDRRAPLRRRPRVSLPRRRQAAHRAVGLGRRAAATRRTRPAVRGARRRLRTPTSELGERCSPSCSTDDEVAAHPAALRAACCAATRCRCRRAAGPSIPWPAF